MRWARWTTLANREVRPGRSAGMPMLINEFQRRPEVKAGQDLAQSTQALSSALIRRAARLASDATTLANAKVDLARYQTLLKQMQFLPANRSRPKQARWGSSEGWWSPTRPVENARINLGILPTCLAVVGPGRQ